jgi:tRNA-splicing ligase RtcB
MSDKHEITLEKIDDYRWKVPMDKAWGMKVPGIIYTQKSMLDHVKKDNTPTQVANVAHLPGIVGYSLAMPDIHWGYGFPIGGVAAFDLEHGIVSPGGVGYDINCGVSLVRTNLTKSEVLPKIEELVYRLFDKIPTGVGSRGPIHIPKQEEDKVMTEGAKWAVGRGYGWKEDLEFMEEKGSMQGANPDRVSPRARERGREQLGTLGSGNHFLEVQVVDEIYDEEIAQVLGLEKGQITVMVHSGSRGFGYQICDDSLKTMQRAVQKYGIPLPDRQLACAPLTSPEGKAYVEAMVSAANFAWANRLCLVHWAREAFGEFFGKSPQYLGMSMIYDVSHNIAKFEKHTVEGKTIELCVHRKGATRAFAPGHPSIPKAYQHIGQPVMIPGDMGRASYVLVGTDKAMKETWGSTCHGAGRMMSRHAAIAFTQGRHIDRELKNEKGIIVMAKGRKTLLEEFPEAYKDVDEVVHVAHEAGISNKVAKLRPLGGIKG